MVKVILVLVLGLYLAILGLVTFVGLDSIHHSHESARTTVALCSLRDNLAVSITERVHQIQRSEQYLADRPNGTRDIPKSLILKGINDSRITLHQQQRNFAALNVLNCQ